MLHRTAKPTPFGRRLLVERILVEGWALHHVLGLTAKRVPAF